MNRWRERRWARRRERVLSAMRRHPTEEFSGYELAGLARLSAGAIYPCLYRLEREGAIIARWVDHDRDGQPRRRLYRLSDAQ